MTNPETQATYLLKSVVEEALKSSQLEGASTTRRVAKDILISGREPRNRSERVIANNYQALQYVRQHKLEPITPSRVLELQTILTEGTLDDPTAAGRFRRDDENIVIEDETGELLHRPPCESVLPDRLQRFCAFASGGDGREFMHPAVRTVLVYFALAYDHPFVDGNGRRRARSPSCMPISRRRQARFAKWTISSISPGLFTPAPIHASWISCRMH